jgi:hypothetical protein
MHKKKDDTHMRAAVPAVNPATVPTCWMRVPDLPMMVEVDDE